MEQKTLKIIKKEKDGITIKAGSMTQKMSWEEFNRNMVMEDDKIHCHFTEEFIKKGEKINKKISQCAATFMILNGPMCKSDPKQEMIYSMVFGKEIEELKDLVGCTLMEAAELVRNTVKNMFSELGQKKETPAEYRRRKKEEAAKRAEDNDPHRTYTPTATTTMGDLPGMDKLKEMFK